LTRIAGRREGGQPAASVERHDGSVEGLVDLDDLARIVGCPGCEARQLEDPPAESNRVVAGDLAAVLEDEDSLEVDLRRERPPGRDRIDGRHAEPRVVAGNEARQEDIRSVAVVDPGQTQLDDEAILEDPPEAFDPALGLGRGGGDRGDVELGQGSVRRGLLTTNALWPSR
jgi:predicted  nucleic acid-binding Zn-ribbon protein